MHGVCARYLLLQFDAAWRERDGMGASGGTHVWRGREQAARKVRGDPLASHESPDTAASSTFIESLDRRVQGSVRDSFYRSNTRGI
jgi:hypothetical protein